MNHTSSRHDKEFIKLDITLIDGTNNEERYFFSNQNLLINKYSKELYVCPIINTLKIKVPKLENSHIYIQKDNMRHYIGADPIEDENITFEIENILKNNKTRNITIIFNAPYSIQREEEYANQHFSNQHHQRSRKLKQRNIMNEGHLTLPQYARHSAYDDDTQAQAYVHNGTSGPIEREKRVKERQIGYVLDQVREWRQLYQEGYPNENGDIIQINLDTASTFVGLSRKTLDDYHQQIQKAEQLGIDIDEYRDQKMGFIRKLIKDSGLEKRQYSDNSTTTSLSRKQKTAHDNECNERRDAYVGDISQANEANEQMEMEETDDRLAEYPVNLPFERSNSLNVDNYSLLQVQNSIPSEDLSIKKGEPAYLAYRNNDHQTEQTQNSQMVEFQNHSNNYYHGYSQNSNYNIGYPGMPTANIYQEVQYMQSDGLVHAEQNQILDYLSNNPLSLQHQNSLQENNYWQNNLMNIQEENVMNQKHFS